MDELLCEESWLSSPITPEPLPIVPRYIHDDHMVEMDEATVEEALLMDLEKESCFGSHGDKFLEFIVSKKLNDSRFQVVQWMIQTKSRLNLSYETVFSAANVFDRFVYVTCCNEWTKWMLELVAVTSLSIASKFNEVTTPFLQELQMDGLNHMFHHKTVGEMEIIMLKALEWRVNSVTSYSFSQILVSIMGLGGDYVVVNRINDHLLEDLCDVKMVQYPPSVVAVAAMWNVLEEMGTRDVNIERIMNLFGQGHKERIMNCVEMMKLRKSGHYLSRKNVCEVKSLVNVLQRGEIMNMTGVYYGRDLSDMFQILQSEGLDKKRDRDEYQDQMRPAKRMTFVMSS